MPIRRDVSIVLIALSPVLVGWFVKVFVFPRPFWAHFFDPEMIFWYGGAALLGGRLPANVDQPGFAVHYLSALFVKASGSSPLPEMVDRFRVMGYCATILLIFLGAVLLTRTCLRDMPLPLKGAALAGYFLAPTALQWTTVWTSEAFYFPLGCLVLAAAWNDFQRQRLRSAFFFGASLGLAVSLKFLFLSWIPGLLLALSVVSPKGIVARTRRVVAGVGGILVAFFVMTGFAASRYPYMTRWIIGLASHSGDYGKGTTEILGPAEALKGLVRWISSARGWWLWIAAFSVVVVVGFWKSSKELRRDPIALGFTGFAIPAFLFGAWGGCRHTDQLRYLLPPALLSIVLPLIAWQYVRFRSGARFLEGAGGAILVVTLAILAKAAVLDVRVHRSWTADAAGKNASLTAILQREWKSATPPVLLIGWRFPAPSFALRIFAETAEQFDSIESRFPREGHYNPFRRQILLPAGSQSWDVAILREDEVKGFPTKLPPPVGYIGEFSVFEASQ